MKIGISLIVLIMTIVIMIILSATIILSLNESDIIKKANEAKELTDLGQIKNLAAIKWSEEYFNKHKSEQELREAVINALKEEGINTDKYKIDVSWSGVDVSEKFEGKRNVIINKLDGTVLITKKEEGSNAAWHTYQFNRNVEVVKVEISDNNNYYVLDDDNGWSIDNYDIQGAILGFDKHNIQNRGENTFYVDYGTYTPSSEGVIGEVSIKIIYLDGGYDTDEITWQVTAYEPVESQ